MRITGLREPYGAIIYRKNKFDRQSNVLFEQHNVPVENYNIKIK
jgi:hypothetical protein